MADTAKELQYVTPYCSVLFRLLTEIVFDIVVNL